MYLNFAKSHVSIYQNWLTSLTKFYIIIVSGLNDSSSHPSKPTTTSLKLLVHCACLINLKLHFSRPLINIFPNDYNFNYLFMQKLNKCQFSIVGY